MYTFPPKLTATVSGQVIEYVVAGSGPSTVVLVNGSGGPIEGWFKVFGSIVDFSQVFAYNRPGIGGSPSPQSRQTGVTMVASLRAVLRAAQLPPPYVLVGHSFGGLIVNLFARLHPNEVSAAVLVEATHPDDVAVLKLHENRIQRLIAVVLEKLAPLHPNSEVRQAQETVAELATAPRFPSIPLAVVSGGKPAMAWATASAARAARAAHQQALVRLSPLGRHIIAARSGHFPQFTEPDLVVGVVREAVHLSRT